MHYITHLPTYLSLVVAAPAEDRALVSQGERVIEAGRHLHDALSSECLLCQLLRLQHVTVPAAAAPLQQPQPPVLAGSAAEDLSVLGEEERVLLATRHGLDPYSRLGQRPDQRGRGRGDVATRPELTTSTQNTAIVAPSIELTAQHHSYT
jgi:hypothetical protein